MGSLGRRSCWVRRRLPLRGFSLRLRHLSALIALAAGRPPSGEWRGPEKIDLARLEVDPRVSRDFDADHAWAEAVQKLNQGNHAAAETDLLAFVAANPQHTAADNALYLAGLIRES